MNPNYEIMARVVCSKDWSLKLIEAGIFPWAHMWHRYYKDPNVGWQIMPAHKERENELDPESNVPAWTKEELDVMLGPGIRLPQLPQKAYTHSLQNPNFHSWFGASIRIDYEKGADCSAAVVLRALEEKAMEPKEMNERFAEVFRLQERGLVGPPKFVPTFDPQ